MTRQQPFFKAKPIPTANGTVKINPNGFIEFSQTQVNNEVQSGKLNKIKIKYNGLCEIICNYVLLEDLMGEEFKLPKKADVKPQCKINASGEYEFRMKIEEYTKFLYKYEQKYRKKITVNNLKTVEHTHILNVTHFISRLLAFLFSVYPCNVFSNAPFAKAPYKKTKLANGERQVLVDKAMLAAKMNELKDGTYLKFFAFNKTIFSMEGHSMLIKKVSRDNYSFFDPNHGEYTKLNIDQLADKINKATKENGANHMAFLDAKAFVKNYQIKKKIGSADKGGYMPHPPARVISI